MRMYALLKENVVVELRSISEEEYSSVMQTHQAAVDIEDWVLKPLVGWQLVGSQLLPPPGAVINIKAMIEAKITYYQSAAGALLLDLYSTNSLSGLTNAQSDQMFEDFQDVLLRIREGAFPTAIYRLQQKQPSGLVSQAMLDAWVAKIQVYL